MKILKLNSKVTDSITGLGGILTHCTISIGGNKEYIFQPGSLSKTTGMPSDKMFVTEERMKGGIFENIDVPMEVLGTMVTDETTGFKGKAVSFTVHLGQCLHVDVKPVGVDKSGNHIDSVDFDIRRLKGPKLKKVKEEDIVKSEKAKPSPMSTNARY